jgi:hypothetical protein
MRTDLPEMRSIQLQKDGWTRRFTALGRRLNEAADLYCELGYEFRLEPVDLDEEEATGVEGCKDCFVTMQARTIYTRPNDVIKRNDYLMPKE